jgi:hypothetical protein
MKVVWKAACLALLVAGVSGAQAQNVTYRKDIKPLKYLGETDEERARNLALFKAWIGPQGWTMKRFEARGGVAGISREELEKIQVKY